MGLQSPAAYLGGLKEYCMCPQELRSERQCDRGRRETKTEKDAKCKNRLETAVSSHPADRAPRQPGQTAGHTQARPTGTREHAAKWRPESHRPRLPLALCPQMGQQGGPGAQTRRAGTQCLERLDSVYLQCQPQEGTRLAPRCQPPSGHGVRLVGGQASTREGGKCGRGRAGRAPSNTSVLSRGSPGRRSAGKAVKAAP